MIVANTEITVETALQMLKQGLSVLPAFKTQKRPMVPWQEWQEELPTLENIHNMFPAPRCCVVCGKVSGNLECLDFDDGGSMFEPFIKKVPDNLLCRLYIERTPSGGYHIVYRCEEPIDGNMKLCKEDKQVLIETRGEGGLILCAPSEGYDTIHGSWENLPVLTRAERAYLLQIAHEISPSPVTNNTKTTKQYKSATPSGGVTPIDDYNQNGKEEMRELLINAGWKLWLETNEKEEWTRPGKTEGCSATIRQYEGCDIFFPFSSNADPFEAGKGYNPFQVYCTIQHNGNITEAVRALGNRGFGSQTAPDYSNLHSSSKDRKAQIEALEEDEDEDDLAQRIDKEVFVNKMPEDAYKLPVFMQQVFDDVMKTAPRQQPEFALATAICATSILCGKKFKTKAGLRANIYCLITGKSGCGKDWGRKFLKKLIYDLEIENCIREGYQSAPAVQNDLKEFPTPKLVLWDEFGKALQSLNQYNASTFQKDIIPLLMKLYTSADGLFIPNIKADVGKQSSYEAIPYPFVTMLNTATPDQLFGNITVDMVSEGFIGRAFLFDEVDNAIRKFSDDVTELEISWETRCLAKDILQGETQEWNPDGQQNNVTEICRVVPQTSEAAYIFRKLDELQEEKQNTAGEESVLWTRTCEQAMKLALIYAVASNPSDPLINNEAAEWGVTIATYMTRKRIYLTSLWVADGAFDAKQKEVFRYIKGQGGKVSRNKLRHRFSKWSIKERQEVLDNMIETKKLYTYTDKSTSDRGTTMYSIRKPNFQNVTVNK